MVKVFLVIDESGAKGYSDKGEDYQGEVGVMAGFLVPEKYIECVRGGLEAIKINYFSDGKVHITDLTPADHQSLREKIFEYLIGRNIICVFEAIHSEGFFRYFEFVKEIHDEAKKKRRSNIKLSNNEKKELLHEQLFQGVFGKAISMCVDNIGETFNLAVITDNIDDSIKKRFKASANELLNFGDKKIRIVTGYDPENKTIVSGSIGTDFGNAKEILGDYSKINYSITCEDSGLTLAADVIANSLNHHFKSRTNAKIGTSLNTRNALKGYPLEGVMYGLWESQGLNYVSDAIFMHPKQPEK